MRDWIQIKECALELVNNPLTVRCGDNLGTCGWESVRACCFFKGF